MKFGIVGLGRMGRNLSLQAIGKKHRVVAYDAAADWELTKRGFELALTLKDLVNQLEAPRIVLMYVPHGKPTDDSINDLSHLLDAGDIVADGGNSHWKAGKRSLDTHHRAVGDGVLPLPRPGQHRR